MRKKSCASGGQLTVRDRHSSEWKDNVCGNLRVRCLGRSVVYAPLGLGFWVSDRVRVRSIISVSFRVRLRVMVTGQC